MGKARRGRRGGRGGALDGRHGAHAYAAHPHGRSALNAARRGDLCERLLTAARRILEAEGEPEVTIVRLAAECSVSVAAPYRHFPNRGALLGELAGHGFVELRAALGAAAATEADARARLVAAGVAYVEHAVAHPHLFRLMFTAQLRDRQSELGPAALSSLRELIDPVTLRVPAEIAVHATWALAHGLAMLRIGDMLSFTREDSRARLEAELGMLLDGIVDGGHDAA